MHKYLSKGDHIYADDGTLKFSVVKIVSKDIYLKALSSEKLKSSKGINAIFSHVKIKENLTRDISMIKFSIINKLDFIGISFV